MTMLKTVSENTGFDDMESLEAESIELSVVTSALNEVGNVNTFLTEAIAGLKKLNISWEIIYIDDGSTDGTGNAVLNFSSAHYFANNIRLIKHDRCRGITAAIEESIRESRGKYICLLPADMESSPESDIPKLYKAIDDKTDVVTGRRIGRGDGKSFASGVYNLLNRVLFNVHLHDANWIKLFRRNKALGISMRSEWHRFFIPILASRGCVMKEVDVDWHPRKFGKSNFGFSRFPVSLADMISVKLILSYGQRPFLPFGYLSFICLIVGIVAFSIGLMAAEGAQRQWLFGNMLGFTSISIGFISFAIGACTEILLGMQGHRDN